MDKIVCSVVLLFGLALCPTSSRADTIYLKSGKTVKGEIVSETDHTVSIETPLAYGTIESKYPKSEIERIERAPVEHTQQAPQATDVSASGRKAETARRREEAAARRREIAARRREEAAANQRKAREAAANQREARKAQEPGASPQRASSIRDNCGRKWGYDYAMVKYCIDKQETAKSSLRAQSSDSGIRSRCEAKWGDDYAMVKYCIDKQEAAKKSLGY